MNVSPAAFVGDIRFAVQSLRRSPGFTLIAIVTLGLGIGANTSMFSILNSYMLRPAPYADRDHLDRIYRAVRQNARGGISPADYLDLKSEMSGYGDIAAYAGADMSLSEPGKPAEMAEGLRASANLFSALGGAAQLGRLFRPDEEVPGNERVLVLSHRYWQNHFGGDAGVIGRTVRVDGEAYEIVGVLPATFSDWRHLGSVDVFRPLALDDKERRDRSSTKIRLVGRRSPPSPAPRRKRSSPSSADGSPATSLPPTPRAPGRLVPIDDSFLGKDAQPHPRDAGRPLRLRGAHRVLQPGEPAPGPDHGALPGVRRALRSRSLPLPDAAAARRRVPAARAAPAASWPSTWPSGPTTGSPWSAPGTTASGSRSRSTGTSSAGRSPRASSRRSPSAWPPRSSPCGST